MTEHLVTDELRGQFFGVGSVGESDSDAPMSYVTRLAVPYWYQLPSKRSEDMIRQFAYVIERFEENGDFILDIDIAAYREMTEDSASILPDEDHAYALHRMMRANMDGIYKTQQTAPATMCFSIRDSQGKNHVSLDMFHFFTQLMKRTAMGQAEHLTPKYQKVILCQDDPALGFVEEAISRGEGHGLSMKLVVRNTDAIYPQDIVPAYHYCYDWRTLKVDSVYPLWEGLTKIVHLDLLRYPPLIDTTQADALDDFFASGGGIALGVLPNTDDGYTGDVISVLRRNLHKVLDQFRASGVDIATLTENAMISTQCGLSRASVKLTRELHQLSERYPAVLREEAGRASSN